MRVLILLAIMLPLPVQAAELWCMPSEICGAGGCKATRDEETSVRLADDTGVPTTLRSNAEDVPMTRTHEKPVLQWQGTNSYGGTEILAVRGSDLAFTHILRNENGEWRASGTCEVQ